MPGHSFRTQSPQKSRRGPTPLPAWDQAIVLSNRGPISQERGADGSSRYAPVLRRSRHCARAARPGVLGDVGGVRHAGRRHARDNRRRAGRPLCRRRDTGCVTSACPRRSIAGTTTGSRTKDSGPCAMPLAFNRSFDRSDFLAYRSANTRFATAVADEATSARRSCSCRTITSRWRHASCGIGFR